MNSVALADINLDKQNLEAASAVLAERIAAFTDRDQTRKIAPPAVEAPGEYCVPEIDAADFDADRLRESILAHGALIVRGLVARDVADVFRGAIDQVMDNGDPANPILNEWYAPPEILKQVMPFPELNYSRAFHRDCGSIMASESPLVAEELIKLYDGLGLREIIGDYLGEEPCISVKKWVLRRVTPPVLEDGWHQDGAFMGTDINSINMWIPLSRCGGDTGAPGMDVLPRRLDKLVSHNDAKFEWSVGQDTIDGGYEGAQIVSPEFDPGDAFFFDHFHLHRTQFREQFSGTRYAIETWFFGSESFPKNQVPMAW